MIRKTLSDLNENRTPDNCSVELNCAPDSSFGDDPKLAGNKWRIDEWNLCHGDAVRGEHLEYVSNGAKSDARPLDAASNDDKNDVNNNDNT